MFDCCILVPNEMNGANHRDFPIAPNLKIGRDEMGFWNYTQISELINKVVGRGDPGRRQCTACTGSAGAWGMQGAGPHRPARGRGIPFREASRRCWPAPITLPSSLSGKSILSPGARSASVVLAAVRVCFPLRYTPCAAHAVLVRRSTITTLSLASSRRSRATSCASLPPSKPLSTVTSPTVRLGGGMCAHAQHLRVLTHAFPRGFRWCTRWALVHIVVRVCLYSSLDPSHSAGIRRPILHRGRGLKQKLGERKAIGVRELRTCALPCPLPPHPIRDI